MELKEFITATLVEIQEGVQDAIEQCQNKKLSGVINPAYTSNGAITASHISSHTQNVEFDIAVTTEATTINEEKGTIKGGIKVVSGSVDKSDSDKESDSKSSRIKFSIPIIPPVTTVNAEKVDIKFESWSP